MQDIVQHVTNHWGDMLGTAVFWTALGHAASTFPVPQNPYGRWLLGCLQYVVGQRIQSTATREGTTVQQKVADEVMLTGSPMAGILAGSTPQAKKDS